MWYWIHTDYFCAGAKTDRMGVIVESAPILKGWIGKTIHDLFNYYHRRGGGFGYEVLSEDYPFKYSERSL